MYVGCKHGNDEEEDRHPWRSCFRKIQISIQFLFRHKSDQDQSDVCHGMKRAKEMLDKDSVFFWRLFQDIFKTSNINFTGIAALISVWLLVTDNVPRITGHTECQQFCEWKDHLQKGFRLCSLQVNIATPQIVESPVISSLAGDTWKAANTSVTGAANTWQRRSLWTTRCSSPLSPDSTDSMCWWKHLSRTLTRVLRMKEEERRLVRTWMT